MSERPVPTSGALADVRVLDISAVLAGPGIARHLADFGADVIKVERAGVGDTARNLGWRDPEDGETYFFKLTNRNKRFIELDLSDADGRDQLLILVAEAHVLVENMRPGKLEALGLGPDVLLEHNPKLVIVRVTAFGQSGPYRDRPGFATLAEAMSGFAALNGSKHGPPTLPPVALTDEVTALAGAFATMVALHSGVGQVVDVNLIESLMQIMGPLPSLWLRGGEQQPRLGSGLPYSVPRGTYQASDGGWIAVSTSADSVAARVMELIGLGGDPRVTTTADRMEHRDLVEERMAAWVGERTAAEALAQFEGADAAAAPVYDLAALAGDPHAKERGIFVEAEGFPMQGVVARLSATPGEIRWPGRQRGHDSDTILPATSWPHR
ncbi:MAG: CoA transferase [Actinomycetia bacterium]|nr:CoA transferase [Actinomycetes bacterium]